MEEIKEFLDHVLSHVENAKYELAHYNIGNANKELYDATRHKPVSVINKAVFLEILNQHFGTELPSRFRKLKEEFNELMEVVESKDEAYMESPQYQDDMIDELADLTGVLFHIMGIVGKSHEDLLLMVADKIKGRDIDPNYKRKHPHKKGGEELYG